MTDPIQRVTLTHVQVPFKETFCLSGGDVALKDAFLVTLETASGLGIGESSPMPTAFSNPSDTPEGCWDDLTRRIAPSLLGKSFGAVEDIAALATTWTGSRFAVAGAETACWDLFARSRKAAIADLLGASLDRIALGVESGLSVGLCPTVVELLRTIETHLVEGYRRVKLKIKPGQDVELVQAVRQHFGDIPLMVDANASYTVADLDVFRELDDFDLLMIEQPMAAGDLEGSAMLQTEIGTPVCLDESADTPAQLQRAIDQRACRIVNLKLQHVGGFGPAWVMHDLCRRAGLACWVGTMPELGVGQAHGIHLATLPNCKYPTDIAPSARWFVDDYVVPPLELNTPGVFSVPGRPGLGFEVDGHKLKHYQVRQEEFQASTTA